MMNNKGYMLVEVILASVIAITIAGFISEALFQVFAV